VRHADRHLAEHPHDEQHQQAGERSSAAAIAALLPTNRPAPMMPPIVIIVTWRGRRERLSEWSSAGTAATASFMGGRFQDA
jgi:hypothetical protein